jgi:amidase
MLALEAGEVSSVELLDAMMANIERMNPSVNAVVATDVERARAEAVAADDARASGRPLGALHGLPMTIKDCYETIGLETTAGAPELATHVPERDADIVRLLRRAGAIVWAKTNVPLYAGDHQTYNDVYGTTNNPWDLTRTAGGSSGGAAAAVACGFTTAEVGSDIGNSIRQPSSNNGVFGLKTTHGLVSGRGHIPGPSGSLSLLDLGVFGPIARSCGDLRLLLEILTNSSTAFMGVPGAALPVLDGPADIADMRLGVWSDDPLSPVDNVVKGMIEAAAATLESAGAAVDAEARPAVPSEVLHDTYNRLLTSALSAGFPETEWVKAVAAAGGEYGPSDNHNVAFARRLTLPHRDWIRADEARAQAQAAWATLFESVDAVLAPIQPVPPYPHDIDRPYGKRTLTVNGAEVPYGNQLFWAGIATLPLLPSVAIPLGLTDDGLPVGVQLIGPMWSDHKLLGMGEEIASVLGVRFTPPPLVTQS